MLKKSEELENERARHAEFLSQHQGFYDELVKILADCIERDDIGELSMHTTYVLKCVEAALNLRLIIQRENERGNV